ncbi:MAG: transporter [Elusimicrobia bacterium]|nr:transporter [Elusimicrobiota bacterium]
MKLLALLAALAVLPGGAASAQEAKRIQDNSFLLEEAYNQEPGVIQHIQNFQYQSRSKTWAYAFTQEWPVPGRTHQLSYMVPVSHLGEPSPGTGIGDVALNYRYQLLMKGPVALAPRLSVLLPTGDYKGGFGSGAAGGQVNIPLSVELSGRWVTHWNAGATFVPGSREPGGAKADTLGFNDGASAIFSVSKSLDLMCEAAWTSSETVQPDGTKQRAESFFINPGLRFALNFKSGLQIVPGVAFPIGVGPSRGESGVFAYLSFEHPLWSPR